MSAHPGTLHKPFPPLHVSPKPVLGPAAPICVGSSEILWRFGRRLARWLRSECGCGAGGKVGLGTLSADFGELSGDPRGALAAPLPPPSPGSDARCPTPPLCQQPACARAGGRCPPRGRAVVPRFPWQRQSELQRGLSAAAGSLPRWARGHA